jgi:hypothetical protein
MVVHTIYVDRMATNSAGIITLPFNVTFSQLPVVSLTMGGNLNIGETILGQVRSRTVSQAELQFFSFPAASPLASKDVRFHLVAIGPM